MWVAAQIADANDNRAALDDRLKCGPDANAAVDCYKLLVGCADLVDGSGSIICKPRYNYLRLRRANGQLGTSRLLSDLLGQSDGGEEGISKATRISRQNVNFYKKLRQELIFLFLAKEGGKKIEAFLHLYRAIEKFSVAFPLLYVKRITDFERAHADIKRLVAQDDSGELRFLDRFAKFLETQVAELEGYTVDFKIDENFHDYDCCQKVFSEIRAVAPKFTQYLEFTDYSFSIPYSEVPTFIVHCRNRMFHNSNDGQRNFNFANTSGAEGLASYLLFGGVHWCALTFAHVFES